MLHIAVAAGHVASMESLEMHTKFWWEDLKGRGH
jgi:hypothetical protein